MNEFTEKIIDREDDDKGFTRNFTYGLKPVVLQIIGGPTPMALLFETKGDDLELSRNQTAKIDLLTELCFHLYTQNRELKSLLEKKDNEV